MPIAQFNIAEARWPLQDKRMSGFMDMVDRINALAERHDGFIWRLELGKIKDGNGLVFNDPQMTWTLSTWDSVEAIADFAFNTVHKQFFRNRAKWFTPMDKAFLALWDVKLGEEPGLAEGEARIQRLWAEGPSDHVYGWDRFTPLAERRAAADAQGRRA